jgi:hypothetical protein
MPRRGTRLALNVEMIVYRHPYRELTADAARSLLLSAISRLTRDPIGDCATEALLRAGDLECALADLAHPSEATAAYVTDAMASHVLIENGTSLREVERSLRGLDLPARLRFRTPLGYAHQALDPRQYAGLVERLHPQAQQPIAVIGVRSIGTSLGAIVAEALRVHGHAVERISVRPSGEPWARVLHWRDRERMFVEDQRQRGAQFLIVDEGPHASGSTFLAVAEALERAQVPRAAIVLCASRMADPRELLAENATERWTRYRCHVASPWALVSDCADLSAGAWRRLVYGENVAAWPACWTQLERLKRRSADGRWLDKFEGLAPYCDAAFERACALAKAGWGPAPTWLGHGFVRYPWLAGAPGRASDLDGQVLRELARYCAFRTRAMRVDEAQTRGLQRMLQTNLHEAFGIELGDRVCFEVEQPVIADARMQPFEWRISGDGRLRKTDGHSHGDGSLLPGPCDICWDLAGAVVEWNMNGAQQEQFVLDYIRLTGDRVEKRLPAYLLGYCAQRLGETYVASHRADPAERSRLFMARQLYRDRLEHWLIATANRPARQRKLTREFAWLAAG